MIALSIVFKSLKRERVTNKNTFKLSFIFIYRVMFTSALYFFMTSTLSSVLSFQPEGVNISISYMAGWLATKSLSSYLWMSQFLPSFLKDSFARFSILGWVFSFSTLNHRTLASVVSNDKSAVDLLVVSTLLYNNNVVYTKLNIGSKTMLAQVKKRKKKKDPFFVSEQADYDVCRCGSLSYWASWICRWVLFIQSGTFSVISSSSLISMM